jgi:hypothetical protein
MYEDQLPDEQSLKRLLMRRLARVKGSSAVGARGIIAFSGNFLRKSRPEQLASRIIELHEDAALHYLSLCASQAANDAKRDLVADGVNFMDAVFYDYAIAGEVGTTVLQAYLPEDFLSLEPARIAEFRQEFAVQRLEYQSAVQEIVADYTGVASEGELETVKGRIVDLAKQKVDDTQKTYQRANKRMALKAFGMTLTPPAIATFIGSALGIGIFAPAGIVAAASLFGAGLLIDHEEAKSERDNSPWSYVLDAAKL